MTPAVEAVRACGVEELGVSSPIASSGLIFKPGSYSCLMVIDQLHIQPMSNSGHTTEERGSQQLYQHQEVSSFLR